MTPQVVGAVDLGSGWLRYRGPVFGAEFHAHDAIQVVVTCRAPVILTAAFIRGVTTDRAVISAAVRHTEPI